jgi:hypothetical protein
MSTLYTIERIIALRRRLLCVGISVHRYGPGTFILLPGIHACAEKIRGFSLNDHLRAADNAIRFVSCKISPETFASCMRLSRAQRFATQGTYGRMHAK